MEKKDPRKCECLTWGRDPGSMKTRLGRDFEEWGTEHHVHCPEHPDNDGKWAGIFKFPKESK